MNATPNRFRPFAIAAGTIVLIIGYYAVRQGSQSESQVAAKEAEPKQTKQADDSDPVPELPDLAKIPEIPDSPDSMADLVGFGINMGQIFSEAGSSVFDQVMGLSTEEELRIGKEAHQEIARHTTLLHDKTQLDRIRKLAEPLLAKRKRKDIDYHFYIVNDDSLNAFAHLGGHVYIHTGLLNLITKDEELRFVIGHEIAHCDLRHCVRSMGPIIRAQEAVGDIGGSLASIAHQAIAVGYSEDQEFESDEWSYRKMREMGISHSECRLGLELLQQHGGHDHGGHDHAHDETVFDHIEEHFQTHPETQDRLDRIDEIKI